MTMVINGSGSITGLSAGGLPDATIQQADLAAGVAGNGPAFSAYGSAAQTVSSATFTKVTLGTEEFDTNNNFASSRFTPTVAGYYQVTGQISFTSPISITRVIIGIYKNGSIFKYGADISTTTFRAQVSSLIFMNGTTDYLELYGYMTGAGTLTFNGSGAEDGYFQAVLVRAA
jgi:hypothetical protein